MKEQTFVAQCTTSIDRINSIDGLANLVISKELLAAASDGRSRCYKVVLFQRTN